MTTTDFGRLVCASASTRKLGAAAGVGLDWTGITEARLGTATSAGAGVTGLSTGTSTEVVGVGTGGCFGGSGGAGISTGAGPEGRTTMLCRRIGNFILGGATRSGRRMVCTRLTALGTTETISCGAMKSGLRGSGSATDFAGAEPGAFALPADSLLPAPRSSRRGNAGISRGSGSATSGFIMPCMGRTVGKGKSRGSQMTAAIAITCKTVESAMPRGCPG